MDIIEQTPEKFVLSTRPSYLYTTLACVGLAVALLALAGLIGSGPFLRLLLAALMLTLATYYVFLGRGGRLSADKSGGTLTVDSTYVFGLFKSKRVIQTSSITSLMYWSLPSSNGANVTFRFYLAPGKVLRFSTTHPHFAGSGLAGRLKQDTLERGYAEELASFMGVPYKTG